MGRVDGASIGSGVTSVCVAIPSIPPRESILLDAINSVTAQTHPVSQISVAVDHHHEGAWTTRNRAARASSCDWTLFLDDDDALLPHCVAHLLAVADEHDADMAWGWFDVAGGRDPFPEHRGRQWDPVNWHVVPIVYLVRTHLLHKAMDETGGFQPDPDGTGAWHVQDKPMFDALHRMGRLHASPETVWTWHHHANTSGVPTRW